MKLIVHGGLGKTATTWLQSVGLPCLGIRQVGKALAPSVEAPDILQYRLFTPIYQPRDMWSRNRSSAHLVSAFAESLSRVLLDQRERAHSDEDETAHYVALSDENLLTYGGVEINIPLLAAVLFEVRSRVEKVEPLDIDVVLTIREQKSYLRSHFAYDYANLKSRYSSFGAFITSGVHRPYDDVFGLLHYDSVFRMLRPSLSSVAAVRFLPYEVLVKQGSVSYLKAFLDLRSTAFTAEQLRLLDGSVNSQSGTGYRLRDQYRRNVIAERLLRGLPGRVPRVVSDGARRAIESSIGDRLIPRDPTRTLSRTADYLPGDELVVEKIFGHSNWHSSQLLGVSLEDFGYAVEEPAMGVGPSGDPSLGSIS